MFTTPLRALLISEKNNFSSALIKKLIESKVGVLVVCHNPNSWILEKEEGGVKTLDINDVMTQKESLASDYVICITNFSFSVKFLDKEFSKDLEKINFAIKFSKTSDTKTLYIFSFSQSEDVYEKTLEVLRLIENSVSFPGLVFVGDLVFVDGEHYGNYLNFILEKTLESGEFGVARNNVFYPLSPEKGAELLLKSLFSLKTYGRKVAVLGKPLRSEYLFFLLKKVRPDISFGKEIKVNQILVQERLYPKEGERGLVKGFLDSFEIKRGKLGLKLLNRKPVFPKFLFKSRLVVKERKAKPFSVYRKILLFLIATFFFLPYVLVFVSYLLLLGGKKSADLGRFEISKGGLVASSSLSKLASVHAKAISNLFLIGRTYRTISGLSSILETESRVVLKLLDLGSLTTEFIDDVLNNEGEEGRSLALAKNISLDLNQVHKDISLLEGEIGDLPSGLKKFTLKVSSEEQIKIAKEKILAFSGVFGQAPKILGGEKPVKYLLVFQNNSLVRPTGGVVQTVVLLTFSGGKLLDVKVYDVNYLDSKLVGEIDPPSALKKYFGIDTWFLKDSNWDPDFPTAATQTEWFVDKELDETVEGVVFLDTEFVKKLQKRNIIFGYEVQDSYPDINFKSDLTRFLEETFNSPRKLRGQDGLESLQLFYEALKNKSFQVFSKDNNLEDIFRQLSLDGSFQKRYCKKENCYYDFLAVVESAVEGNSENIKRQVEFKTKLEENLIKREAKIFIENPSGVPYKTYLRIFTREESGFSPVTIIGNQERQTIEPEVKGVKGLEEAGVFVQIGKGQAKAIIFSWEGSSNYSFKDKGEYRLFWQKQAGIESFPIELIFEIPEGLRLKEGLPFLTESGDFVYNTVLAQDLDTGFSWYKNE